MEILLVSKSEGNSCFIKGILFYIFLNYIIHFYQIGVFSPQFQLYLRNFVGFDSVTARAPFLPGLLSNEILLVLKMSTCI